jgi:hypothetical protein
MVMAMKFEFMCAREDTIPLLAKIDRVAIRPETQSLSGAAKTDRLTNPH